jgi:hypothetical protein
MYIYNVIIINKVIKYFSLLKKTSKGPRISKRFHVLLTSHIYIYRLLQVVIKEAPTLTNNCIFKRLERTCISNKLRFFFLKTKTISKKLRGNDTFKKIQGNNIVSK